MKNIILTALATLLAANAAAYELNGNSDDGFILKCNDGTTNKTSVPPNHNSATAFCEDHGGIASGYPKKVMGKVQAARTIGSPTTGDNNDRTPQKRPMRNKVQH
ncbi:hypothetical protein [Marinimicrobium agarilyticum]|uniref:hypothetical protein n=1 Tax=Marinimicrobium agarilyticum TaxID=306546 RepID=UPI00041E3199|nr:hypothetical protein [Marinimicrobium agarilyticum]